ncbi:MAG: phosphoesterase [Acidimicrobiaceae bacterium]|nr:phosphoesterase [Acidimicrobiaceae bacterium]
MARSAIIGGLAGRLAALGSAALGAAAIIAASVALPGPPALAEGPVAHRPLGPITHVVEVMLENHTFDDLFSGFPGADGIPAGTNFANPTAPGDPSSRVAALVAPANEGDVQGGLNNSRAAELKMMDRQGTTYRMDGYTLFPGEGLSAITTFAPTMDPDLQYLARHFELADRNFQPAVAPTLPNVLYALAATSHGQLTNSVPPTGSWSTIFSELSAAHEPWRIYSGVPVSVFQGTVWTRLFPAGSGANLTSATQFFTDLAGGQLPAFSFVRPGVGYSEEPPEDVGQGDTWLGQLVEAVARSRYWSSTAIFVTYDEGGGFFDHVSPPVVPGSAGYGTRTPMVIVSPWVRSGVFAKQTTNLSVLAFVQHLWGLAPLDGLNAEQNDLAGAFDFHRKPLSLPRLPVTPAETIGFYGASILADVGAALPGQALSIALQQNTAGLSLDPRVGGRVSLTLVPPAGLPAPPGFPASVVLDRGRAQLVVRFSSPGYYRLHASGRGGSEGWLTLDVGVTPNTP